MVEPDTGVLRILCLIDVGHKIKPSLLRSVIGFMREVCMCHCENCNFFSLEMNRNSLHLHSGGPMRHIRSHLSKLQWLRSSHCSVIEQSVVSSPRRDASIIAPFTLLVLSRTSTAIVPSGSQENLLRVSDPGSNFDRCLPFG
jgi:hypothetical protein